VGLFSSKYETTIGTQVSRVIQDDGIPNSVRSGLIKALFQNGDIPAYLLEELNGSIGVRLERMYEYARRSYVYGMPSGNLKDTAQGRDQVQAVLDAIEGSAVTIDYLHIGAPNSLHIGWMKLMAERGYNPANNEIVSLTNSLDGGPVYLDDMVVVLPESTWHLVDPEMLEMWGVAARAGYTPQRPGNVDAARALVRPTQPQVDATATDEYLKVSYVWVGPGTVVLDGGIEVIRDVVKHGSFTMPITGWNDDADYYHARYTVNGVSKYWIYEIGSGGYPQLDSVFNTPPEENGSFFPFAYFRFAKQDQTTDKTTQAYKTTRKMLRYIGMDFDQVAEAMHENPDIADIEQAMLMVAVPANTTNELERRYLFDFFTNWFESTGDQFPSLEVRNVYRTLGEEDIAKYSLGIQDNRFKMALQNGGIYKKRKAGSIGPVGAHNSGMTITSYEKEFVEQDTGIVYRRDIPVRYHYYQRQISTGFYDEIQVVELKTLFHIFENYVMVAGDDQDILMVPVDYSIVRNYMTREREVLYTRSLHYVFNSRVVTKLKWYEQEWFADLMMIVAIVVTVMSFGSDGGSAIGAALAIGNYAGAAALIAMGVLEYLVTVAVVKLFVKLVGAEAALVVAIIAAVAGYAMETTDVVGSLANAPWAKDLLTVANGLIKEVGTELREMMADLIGESKEFELLADAKMKSVETAQELLEGKNWLSPFVIFGEKPEDYFNRTVHSGNIGVVGIDAIGSFVDIALKLPEIDDTLGGDYV